MSRFLKDFDIGLTKENEVLRIIKQILMIIQFVNQMEIIFWIYFGDNKLIEFKSRHNFVSKYPS